MNDSDIAQALVTDPALIAGVRLVALAVGGALLFWALDQALQLHNRKDEP
jgi:hypothetical protein